MAAWVICASDMAYAKHVTKNIDAKRDGFLQAAFADNIPEPQNLWLSKVYLN